MGIGAQSPFWRRFLYRLFAFKYFKRKCKTSNGVFQVYVSPGSSLGVLDFRKPLVDPVHERFIRDWVKPDAIVWDIGGNLGLFALPAALKAATGHVYVIEPDVDLAANLCRSLRLRDNKGLNVTVVCLAVSASDGVAAFQISKFSRAMNKLKAAGSWHESQIVTEELRMVPTMTIDTLVKSLKPPTALKIDVEGAEVDVLKGASATIAAFRPAVLIEGPNELWGPMHDFFEKQRYILLDGETDHQSPLAHPAWNTIAIPRELLQAS
jgi:FkbM family methyltransferase